MSRLASLADNPAGTTHDQTLGFAYNPAGQITQQTRSNDLFAWAGHGSGTTNSTANGLNQITAHGGTSTSHDARGNMTADGLGKTFGYTSENLLTSVSGSVAASYDPAMRLYQVAGTSTTRFAFDGADMIAEYDGANALQRRFVHGPGTDEPLVWYEGSGISDRRFLHADERGSIVAVSNSSGTVTNVNTYDEYGKPGSGNVGRFQYTGQKWIAELGLYDYKARMYDPGLPRFMQTDPIGYGGGMNRYVYPTDPVNFTDPMGLTVQEIVVTAQRGIVVTGTRLPFCDRSANMLLSVCGGGGWQGNERPNFGLTDRGDADSGERRSPQNRQCSAPAFQEAKKHPNYRNVTREAVRTSKVRGNKETGFNFGPNVFTGSRGFGDVYGGRYPRSIIFRDDIDSLVADGIWNPTVHFHVHPPGTDPQISVADRNFARSTGAVVVAISEQGTDCFDGSK